MIRNDLVVVSIEKKGVRSILTFCDRRQAKSDIPVYIYVYRQGNVEIVLDYMVEASKERRASFENSHLYLTRVNFHYDI